MAAVAPWYGMACCQVLRARSKIQIPLSRLLSSVTVSANIKQYTDESFFTDSSSRTRHNSVVAILTLEVTGIPELSDNREFPWPKPGFIEPTRAFVFEVRPLL